MAKTEVELAKAAEDLTSAALALQQSLDVSKRQRRRDRWGLVLAFVLIAGMGVAVQTAGDAAKEAKEQAETNGQTLQIVKDVTDPACGSERCKEARAASDARTAAFLTDLVERIDCKVEENLGLRPAGCPD